jgi:hypothetical protein
MANDLWCGLYQYSDLWFRYPNIRSGSFSNLALELEAVKKTRKHVKI